MVKKKKLTETDYSAIKHEATVQLKLNRIESNRTHAQSHTVQWISEQTQISMQTNSID